jgi:hypothetical protein
MLMQVVVMTGRHLLLGAGLSSVRAERKWVRVVTTEVMCSSRSRGILSQPSEEVA